MGAALSVFFTCASAGSQTSEAGGNGGSTALSAQFCANGKSQTVQQRDRVLQFAAVVRQALQESGEQVAVISRSGLDLSRFKLRYSHSGVLLASDGDVPWSVSWANRACSIRAWQALF